MKQRITVEQLNGLSDEQKERLREWCAEKGYGEIKECSCGCGDKYLTEDSLPLLSIGQMIDFLQTDLEVNIENPKRMYWSIHLSTRASMDTTWMENGEEVFHKYTLGYFDLCDALWEAIKVVLQAPSE